jgi:hypothetical protein
VVPSFVIISTVWSREPPAPSERAEQLPATGVIDPEGFRVIEDDGIIACEDQVKLVD